MGCGCSIEYGHGHDKDEIDFCELHAAAEEMREALELVQTAIEDWLHSYAPALCGEPYVTETANRIKRRGGTLNYIAELTGRNRALLDRTKPQEKNERT